MTGGKGLVEAELALSCFLAWAAFRDAGDVGSVARGDRIEELLWRITRGSLQWFSNRGYLGFKRDEQENKKERRRRE